MAEPYGKFCGNCWNYHVNSAVRQGALFANRPETQNRSGARREPPSSCMQHLPRRIPRHAVGPAHARLSGRCPTCTDLQSILTLGSGSIAVGPRWYGLGRGGERKFHDQAPGRRGNRWRGLGRAVECSPGGPRAQLAVSVCMTSTFAGTAPFEPTSTHRHRDRATQTAFHTPPFQLREGRRRRCTGRHREFVRWCSAGIRAGLRSPARAVGFDARHCGREAATVGVHDHLGESGRAGWSRVSAGAHDLDVRWRSPGWGHRDTAPSFHQRSGEAF